MKGQKISSLITFECHYQDGDCKYKNPGNKYKCNGCTYSTVINQTTPVIHDTCSTKELNPNKRTLKWKEKLN